MDHDRLVYEYKGRLYPEYLKHGNACQFIIPVARHFCKGVGFDVGAGAWPLPGAIPVTPPEGDALNLPDLVRGHPDPDRAHQLNLVDYIFSSHCLEHLHDPVEALCHWKDRLRSGGVLLLYLPHPDMEYWLPQNCRKHKHTWFPYEMAKLVTDLGFRNVIISGRDMAWSFAVVGFK